MGEASVGLLLFPGGEAAGGQELMDSAVSLVQAYLRVNGYFTVTEYPVIAAGRGGTYRAATDLDVLAMRFPHAGRLVPGRTAERDEDHNVVDSALAISVSESDMLIGEVKEGHAELNAGGRDPGVLRAVLVGFGCCRREDADGIVAALLRNGHARLPNGHMIRSVVFASTPNEQASGKYLFVALGQVVAFLRSYVADHWEVLRHADSKDPAFGFLMTLAKAEKGMQRQ
jgi:hypothetical protein